MSYDADGNLTSDGVNTYVWNARNQLSQISTGGTVQASYTYDAVGRRTAKAIGGSVPTQFLYDGDNAVQETVSGVANPILTGLGVDERFARNDVTGQTYFLADALGSTIALTNTAGAIQQQYSYDPYGNVTQSNATSGFTNPYQYAGREADGAGLYYNRARYYSPGMGRFISEDPTGFGGGQLNLYAYVGSNPLSYIDPFGLRYVDVYVWNAKGSSVGHVMVTEDSSQQVILSQFPANGMPLGQNVTKSFSDTMAAEGRPADSVWRIDVPNDNAFDQAAAHERGLSRWSWDPSKNTTQCSIAASRSLRAGGVGLTSITDGTLMPGFFNNNIQKNQNNPGNDIHKLPP